MISEFCCANPTEPRPVNAQQEATLACGGDNAAGSAGFLAASPAAEVPGFPPRPQTAKTLFGEEAVAQVNAHHLLAGHVGEQGHQGVGPLATPAAAAPAQATGRRTTRAPRRTLTRSPSAKS
ncbi:unnamed protein product [Cercospora beticola]|nr:unnamed protein product [Cercospora beticola]